MLFLKLPQTKHFIIVGFSSGSDILSGVLVFLRFSHTFNENANVRWSYSVRSHVRHNK